MMPTDGNFETEIEGVNFEVGYDLHESGELKEVWIQIGKQEVSNVLAEYVRHLIDLECVEHSKNR